MAGPSAVKILSLSRLQEQLLSGAVKPMKTFCRGSIGVL